MQKGLYDSARRDAKTFAECQPGNYLAYWLMGDCYFNLTDYRNAIGEYTRAIAIEPDPVVYTTRGRAYLLAEEFNLAINDFTRVLDTDPANAEVGELLALAREGKESEGAEEDFLQNVMATILSGGLEALTDLDDNWVMEMMLGALLGGL
jgi:tetratricopeptide (TPR) repeat protein